MLVQKSLLSLTVLLIAAITYPFPGKAPQEAGANPPNTTVATTESTVAAETKPGSATEMPDGMKRDQSTREKLKQIANLDYDETEFQEVLEELESALNTAIHLDQSCKDDSLTLDQPVSFKMNGFPTSVTFRELLFEHNATYVVKNGLIKVISRDIANDPDYFSRRYLDVSDVLQELVLREPNRVGKFVRRKWAGPRSGGVFNQSGGGGFGGGGGGNTTQSKIPPQGKDIKVIAEEFEVSPEEFLIDTIKSTVDTDGWDSMGGEGNLYILGGVLIVNSIEETANEVEDLLQNLRHNWSK